MIDAAPILMKTFKFRMVYRRADSSITDKREMAGATI
jgi:hypothetical protein